MQPWGWGRGDHQEKQEVQIVILVFSVVASILTYLAHHADYM
jgi:hypothetical protein